MLLSAAFCPPVQYLAAIAEGMTLSPDRVVPSTVYVEACENWQKQSYRNRCIIATSDGPMSLNFPIVHEHMPMPIAEVRVDYKTPWVPKAERAIATAYESSPYFDYYKDEFFSILDSRPERLWDLDIQTTKFFLEKTGVAADLCCTDHYAPTGECTEDLRETIHPKRPDTILRDLGLEKPYFQVFAEKYGFLKNLSVMDLLFNEGPDSILWLKRL